MLTMKNDIYYMRPFSIMVRFPGRFFETHAAKMSNINQIILVISSVILVCISVTIWKGGGFIENGTKKLPVVI